MACLQLFYSTKQNDTRFEIGLWMSVLNYIYIYIIHVLRVEREGAEREKYEWLGEELLYPYAQNRNRLR